MGCLLEQKALDYGDFHVSNNNKNEDQRERSQSECIQQLLSYYSVLCP